MPEGSLPRGRVMEGRLLLNPSSAGGRALHRIRKLLDVAQLEVRETHTPEEMSDQARRAADEGLDRVLVAGGDGAVHHAVQGLAGSGCALGIVPTGTGNDLARALGIELDPCAAGLRALRGVTRTIDVGRVGARLFVGVAGIGFDGDVNRIVRQQTRWLRGSAAYACGVLRALASFEPPHVHLEYAGGDFAGQVLLVAVANSPCFGGGMRIAPSAVLDDGWLDLVVIERVPLVTLLRVFPRVYRGTHIDHPAVHTARVRSLHVTSEPRRVVYADGEPLHLSTAPGERIEIWPGALRVVS